jgi:DNA-binding transcriptional ArsR family regulator
MKERNTVRDEAEPELEAPPIDDAFYRALAARPRRRILAYLLEEQQSTVSELADVLCGWELSDETMITPDRHEAIRIALQHSHLPQLADAGLITVDRGEGTVQLLEVPDPGRELLRRSVNTQ